MPTGLVQAGEDISEAAVREVAEETGVRARFGAVLAMRQAHGFAFGKSDFFFVVALTLEPGPQASQRVVGRASAQATAASGHLTPGACASGHSTPGACASGHSTPGACASGHSTPGACALASPCAAVLQRPARLPAQVPLLPCPGPPPPAYPLQCACLPRPPPAHAHACACLCLCARSPCDLPTAAGAAHAGGRAGGSAVDAPG
jgi:ADP-ribose pyrophosphatase YjhB (NUDIX family)